ncbi:hypothetical protein WN944_010330 [Citrus x changshan-huyou]|uniref:Uncharacterized protein n=1 Tax=Citrus x changshan-huyou TaxID=2935761 RepID=A0AAP0MUP4_9ROSI
MSHLIKNKEAGRWHVSIDTCYCSHAAKADNPRPASDSKCLSCAYQILLFPRQQLSLSLLKGKGKATIFLSAHLITHFV